jgi:glycosyltransferase involved in cell wall biosynthesis
VHTTYLYYDRAGYHPKPYYKISAMIERYCLNKFDRKTKFVCINDSIFEELKDIGIRKEKIKIIPNGVFTKRFNLKKSKSKLREKLGLPKDKKIILSVGRLTEQKQPFKLMEFFSLVEKKDNDFFLVVGGKGELLEKTKQRAKERGIKNISFLGYVPEENIPSLYLCSDYYILLSLYEALPLTLLDAMAAGLPSIVTDIPGMAVARRDNCGIILDINQMNKGVNDILGITPRKYLQLSKNAKKSSDQFDWGNIGKSYLEVMDSSFA